MRRIILIALIQLFAVGSLFAQFETPEGRKLNLLKSKTLLVPLKEEVTRTLIDLKSKPEEYEKYKQAIATHNELLKRAVEKHWTVGRGEVEFMPESDVKKLIDEGNPRYAVLTFELRSGKFIDQFKYIDVYANGPYDSDVRQIAKSEGYGVYKLILPSRQGIETVHTVQVPVAYPSEGDMIFAVQQMVNLFNTMQKNREYIIKDFESDVTAHNATLKKRTLLIDKYQLASKTDLEDLKKSYPYPIDVVDYEMINAAITSQDASYAYVQIIPYGMPDKKIDTNKIKLEIFHIVADANGGKVLATSKPTRLNYDKVAEDISKKEVKDYVK